MEKKQYSNSSYTYEKTTGKFTCTACGYKTKDELRMAIHQGKNSR